MSFPTTILSWTTLTDNEDDVLAQHPNTLASEIIGTQTKVGIDNSSDTTSIDYFLKNSSGAYRTHTHDGSSDDGANIPINNITEFNTSSLANGQILVYNSTSSKYENTDFIVTNRTSDPSSPVAGQIWFRTDV